MTTTKSLSLAELRARARRQHEPVHPVPTRRPPAAQVTERQWASEVAERKDHR